MLLVAGLVFSGALFSQARKESGGKEPKEKEQVDIGAGNSYFDSELNRTLGIDENAKILVGEVVFHHNGAVISCDSAVHYSDRRIDCFRNVIINKDSIFVYGERAEYNGDRNLARIYSPVVKIIDGDATLYTYNFAFNTLDNIGTWYGGGVMYQKDNTLESEKGYYYSDLHELVAVRNVEMKNEDYRLTSDSMRYNTGTKIANFYTKTYIWTSEGEIVTADRGRYDTRDSTYFFHGNAYVLTEFRETWADTIDFNAKRNDAILYGNIQIDDNEHSSSAFGDYGRYWGKRGETMLTRRPSLLNFDEQNNDSDTVYMRADTIFMYVIYPSDRADRAAEKEADKFAHLRWADSLPDSVRVSIADSLRSVISGLRRRADGLRRTSDSIMNALYPPPVILPAFSDTLPPVADTLPVFDSLPPVVDTLPPADTLPPPVVDTLPLAIDPLPHADSLSVADTLFTSRFPLSTPETVGKPEKVEPPEVVTMRGTAAEISAKVDSLQTVENYIRPKPETLPPAELSARDSLAMLAATDSLTRVDSLAFVDSLFKFHPREYKKLKKAEAKRLKQEIKTAKNAEEQRLREEKRAAKAAEKAARISARRKRAGHIDDSLRMADSLRPTDSLMTVDSLRTADSLLAASLDSLPPAGEPVSEPDTTERIWRGWYDVKVWRKDMQAVCDSIVGFSRDSTVHMYTDPVLWNGGSQIVCDSLTIYTSGENIDRAEFFGGPIMGSELGPRQYNQVTGRTMTSWFREGEVYRHDVKGNAEAFYYVQEEDRPEPVAFIVMTAADMSFLMEDQYVRYIIAREQPMWPVYPIEQIPTGQPVELKGFEWYSQRQPSLADVFDRRIRPAEREFHESLPGPAFPIAARIDRRREYLIRSLMWADRVDPLPAYAVEFVRSLPED